MPYSLASRVVALPLMMRGGRLVVALEDPTQRKVLDEIEFAVGCKVIPVLARARTLFGAIERAYDRIGADTGSLRGESGVAVDYQPDEPGKLLATLEQRIQGRKKLQKSQITITPDRGRPAFNVNAGGRQIVDRAVAIHRETGSPLAVVDRIGGGTDAAYAALSGKPVIEALGLPGYGYHSDEAEYVMVDAIPRRLYLATRLIMELSQGK